MEEREGFLDHDKPVKISSPRNENVPSAKKKLYISKKCIFISFVGSLGFFSGGLVRGWSSPSVASIQGFNNNTDYVLPQSPLSREEISWICSAAPLGATLGSLISSFSLHHFGRKSTLMISSVIMGIGFTLLGLGFYSESVIQLNIARALNGFCVGLSVPAGQIYITECVDASVRGLLGSLPAAAMAFGILFCYTVGTSIPWHYLSFLCVIVPVIETIMLFTIPETPMFLLLQNKEERAYKSLMWLRRGNVRTDANAEFESMKRSIEEKKSHEEGHHFRLADLTKKSVYHPLFIVMMITVYQQWNGIFAVLFNLSIVFDALTMPYSEKVSTIIIGVTQFLGTLGSVLIVDKAGRRVMLMTSALIMALSNGVLGGYFYYMSQNSVKGLEWLPLLCLVAFMIGYSIGFASIPFIILGELLPNKLRGALGGTVALCHMINMFVVVKTFSNLESIMRFDGVFLLYSLVSFSAIIFVYFLLPETKGKTLEEIEDMFKPPRK